MSTFSPGTLFVPNENAVNGACLLNSNTGAFVQNPITLAKSNEGGAAIVGGTFIIADVLALSGGSGPLRIYNSSFSLIASTANFAYPATLASTSDGSAFFYCNTSISPAVVTKINAATGATVFSDTLPSMTVTQVYAMAVDSKNTVLYYFDTGSGTTCHRWDLVNHVALPDLFTIPSGGAIWGRDLILTDDAFLSMIAIRSDDINYDFRRFAINGTPVQTIALSSNVSNGDVPRLAADLGAPSPVTAVWMRTYPNTPITTSVFTQVDFVTSTFLTTLTVPTGHPGDAPDPTKAPDSCPFFAWSNNLVHVTPFVGTLHENNPLVRVRQCGLPALDGNVTQFIGRAEVQMQPGLGVPDDPTANPVIGMAWSGDNALTFNTEQPLNLGRTGAYYTRAYKHVVGSMRQPAVKVICSDDVTFVPTDLFVTREPGTG